MSANAYDELAPFYVEHARTRAVYCNAVDRYVLEWAPEARRAMLDVGSGDGGRAVRLAESLSATRLTLSDPSPLMARQCRAQGGAEVWPIAAEAIPTDTPEFDLVTCLWNVLGAVEGAARRLEALRRMGSCLAPGGRIVIDVHNRYDLSAAGAGRVLARVARDIIRPSASNGSVAFTWRVGGQQIAARGYLFTLREMRQLFRDAGLTVVRQAFVDYEDGRARGAWTGQMLFCLEVVSSRDGGAATGRVRRAWTRRASVRRR